MTYLDLVLGHIEGQAANNNLAVLRSSRSWASSGLYSRSGRLQSLLDTTNGCSSGLVATRRSALGLLLGVDDGVKRLV